MAHPVWPARKPRPFHEALEVCNRRASDRVEFSDELRRLNREHDLRELRCACPPAVVPETPADLSQSDRNEPRAARPASIVPPLSAEPERTAEIVDRYEVTHRSTTGRLIDMLM